jgi:hypothetical protein
MKPSDTLADATPPASSSLSLDAAQTKSAGLSDVMDGDQVTITATVNRDGDMLTLKDVTVEKAGGTGEPEDQEDQSASTKGTPPETAAERMGIKPKKSKSLSPADALGEEY